MLERKDLSKQEIARVNIFLKQSYNQKTFSNIESLFSASGMLDTQIVDVDVVINLLAAMPIQEKNHKAVKAYILKLVPVLSVSHRRRLNQAIEPKLLSELYDKEVYKCMIAHSCITYRCLRHLLLVEDTDSINGFFQATSVAAVMAANSIQDEVGECTNELYVSLKKIGEKSADASTRYRLLSMVEGIPGMDIISIFSLVSSLNALSMKSEVAGIFDRFEAAISGKIASEKHDYHNLHHLLTLAVNDVSIYDRFHTQLVSTVQTYISSILSVYHSQVSAYQIWSFSMGRVFNLIQLFARVQQFDQSFKYMSSISNRISSIICRIYTRDDSYQLVDNEDIYKQYEANIQIEDVHIDSMTAADISTLVSMYSHMADLNMVTKRLMMIYQKICHRLMDTGRGCAGMILAIAHSNYQIEGLQQSAMNYILKHLEPSEEVSADAYRYISFMYYMTVYSQYNHEAISSIATHMELQLVPLMAEDPHHHKMLFMLTYSILMCRIKAAYIDTSKFDPYMNMLIDLNKRCNNIFGQSPHAEAIISLMKKFYYDFLHPHQCAQIFNVHMMQENHVILCIDHHNYVGNTSIYNGFTAVSIEILKSLDYLVHLIDGKKYASLDKRNKRLQYIRESTEGVTINIKRQYEDETRPAHNY